MQVPAHIEAGTKDTASARTTEKAAAKLQRDVLSHLPGTWQGGPSFLFSSQITMANISTKAAPTKRFGTPVLGQQTAPPLAVPSACASPPAAQDCSRPSGSPGSGRVPAGPPAAPEQAGPCRWLGSGPSYLQGQAMHRSWPKLLGDRCQARLCSQEGLGTA